MERILLIGYGNMGNAILTTLTSFVVDVIEPNKQKHLEDRKDKTRYYTEFSEVVVGADDFFYSAIIIAIKPQSFEGLCLNKDFRFLLNKKVNSDSYIISMMAGITLATIAEKMNLNVSNRNFVRIMPNVCALIGKSITATTLNEGVVKQILESFSQNIMVIAEKEFNKFTAVFGSGPGFIYQILLDYINASQKILKGYSDEEIKRIVCDMFVSSIELSKMDGDPESIRNKVASKGGTTEAGLKKLQDSEILSKLLTATLMAAVARGNELAEIK